MRRFHSYGPVDLEQHFGVARTELVDRCVNQLVGNPDKEGHYFTIWAARQTGKTWLMRQAITAIHNRYGEQFATLNFSLGRLRGMAFDAPSNETKSAMPDELGMLLKDMCSSKSDVTSWKDFHHLFAKGADTWDRPLIMLIDEVDTLSPALLDLLVAQFRELYLYRESNWLHGVALVGVRAVVGIESVRGSPFNVQRSLHVPNLTADEVREMYQHYQDESGQPIEPAIIEKVYDVTRGQPGLVSWFGELLTETYNPGAPLPIGNETWEYVWNAARFLEPNNTVMNLIAKARMPEYQPFLVEMFKRVDIPFLFHDLLHNYLYMHGIIEPDVVRDARGRLINLCRFTSPFIQDCLYSALSHELVADTPTSVLALHPLDTLTDVFESPTLNVPALLQRYKEYLARLKAKGLNPWKSQPRRTDYQLTETVGHFHLYAWLQQAIGRRCVVSPEFPTGNGRIDVHLRCDEKRGLIEVKSFVDAYQLSRDRVKVSVYAQQVGLTHVTMAVFIPILDEDILATLSTTETHDGVEVTVVMIGWF